MIEDVTDYEFVAGHSAAIGLMAIREAALAEYTPEYFWAAVLVNMAGYSENKINLRGGLLYSKQTYINEIFRKNIPLFFPPSDELTLYPYVKNDGIIIGSKLLHQGNQFRIENYSAFLQKLENGASLEELEQFQLEKKFQAVLTHNPMQRISREYWFNPQNKNKQTIIGKVANQSRYKVVNFITLDSGELVQTQIYQHQLIKEGSHLFNANGRGLSWQKFWLVDLIYNEDRDNWEIVKIYNEKIT
jgi:hypothetical protein